MNPDPERNKETQKFKPYNSERDCNRFMLIGVCILAATTALVVWALRYYR
jgi:hypothetical protein